MFNLFRKKESGIKVIDKIMMTRDAKWKALSRLVASEGNLLLIFWFDDTLRQAKEAMSETINMNEKFLLSSQVQLPHIAEKRLVFAEHYPLAQKEKGFFEKLHLQQVEIWSAMDEPLFKEFGSDKIVQMMKQLGMIEEQVIEHNMISKAIHNAQEKIEAKVTVDQMASSQEEWLRKNWKINS